MGKAETKNKNVAMAARLKAEGVQRSNATCPNCHKRTPAGSLYSHMLGCGGNYQGRK